MQNKRARRADDIPDANQGENGNEAHLRFLENMDRINRAIQGANDLEIMLSDVLDCVLSIFNCDRAFLLYPCDDRRDSWHVPIERTEPEYPGAPVLGGREPMDEQSARKIRAVLDHDGPVKFGPGSKYLLLPDADERFGFKAFMAMGVYPKVGDPWMFGIHQCSYPRVWSPFEERLMQEIGRRLTDGLTGLLTYRDLQQRDAEVRRLQEYLQMQIDRMPIGLIVWDRDFNVQSWNPAAADIFGYSAEEAIGKHPYDLIIPKDVQPVMDEIWARLINGDLTAHGVNENITKDGRTVLCEWTNTPLRGADGATTSVLSMVKDITKRSRAKQALRESEERYRRIVDTANEGIWMLGPDTKTTFVNARMAEMLGYQQEEMVGRPVTSFMFEEDAADHLRKMDNRRQEVSENYERRFRRKDGSEVWTLASATPIFDERHRFNGSFAMFSDITERRMGEEQKRDFYRRTILAATEDKLQLTERNEVERIAGPPMNVFQVASPPDLHEMRSAVIAIARSSGVDELRAEDYGVAVSEAVTNAIKHAGGGSASIHLLPGSILFVVSDLGPGIEAMTIPEVALERGYTTAGTLGMGFKIMISIADKVYLATGPWGTTVGIEVRLQEPESTLDQMILSRIKEID